MDLAYQTQAVGHLLCWYTVQVWIQENGTILPRI